MNKKFFMGLIIVPTLILISVLLLFVLKNESTGELAEPDNAVSADTVETSGSYNSTLNASQNQMIAATTQPQQNKGAVDACSQFRAITTSKIFNNELQIYLSDQSYIGQNKISIMADKIGNKYISGKVESRNAFRFGEFSFKINSMDGKGLFPAIWMLPEDGGLFPETDIFEQIGSDPRKFYGVVHFDKNGEKLKNSCTFSLNEDESHDEILIEFKWTKDSMVWKINGCVVHTIRENVPQVPVHMIMNLAVGGNWPGIPNEKTKFPAVFNVEVLKFAPKEIYPR